VLWQGVDHGDKNLGDRGLREHGIQSAVGLERYGGHAERFRLCDKTLVGTEISAHLYKIRSVVVTTTLELKKKKNIKRRKP